MLDKEGDKYVPYKYDFSGTGHINIVFDYKVVLMNCLSSTNLLKRCEIGSVSNYFMLDFAEICNTSK